jgi:ATP-binding cassette, subfamily B, bacterial HlyB/CyaB
MASLLPLSWAARSFSGHSRHIAELILLSITLRLLALVSPFAMQAIIDRILPFERQESLSLILALLLTVALFQAVIGYASGRLSLWLGTAIGRDLALRAITHILHLPYAAIQRWQTGDLIARIGEVQRIQSFLGYATTGLLLDAAFALVYAGVLVLISPPLTAVLLLALPIQLGIYLVFGPLERRRYDRAFLAGAAHGSRMIDILSKMLTVKALAAEAECVDRLSTSLTESARTALRAENLALAGRTVSSAFESVLTALVIFIGARLVLSHELTLGQLVSFHLLSGHVTGPILGLAGLWDDWQNVQVARRRIGEVIAEPAEPSLRNAWRGNDETEFVLELKALSFAYPDRSPILRDLTLSLPRTGVALVTGPSGSGKSTMGKLVSALLKPSSGQIRFEGRPVQELSPAAYRRLVHYVPQSPDLFSASLRDNLTVTREVGDDAILDILGTLGLSHLAHALDTTLGESGLMLSGGEAQRVALARAILSRPRVLVLDEPTSSLDHASSQRVARVIADLSRAMAIMVITHEPELFPTARRIVELAPASLREYEDHAA